VKHQLSKSATSRPGTSPNTVDLLRALNAARDLLSERNNEILETKPEQTAKVFVDDKRGRR
jgi:hypothetical protein